MRKDNKFKSRIGLKNFNNQGCIMKIVEYNNSNDIIVEFQDEYKTKVHSKYEHYKKGNINNPYYPALYGVGIVGNKCPASSNGKDTKEYKAWSHIIERCFSDKYKFKQPTYMDVTICKEWLLYENFYEWLHSQSNFKQWYNGKRWGLDKDIIIKGSKMYSQETCCLVPQNVNNLFTKNNIVRGSNYIGVHKQGCKYISSCNNPFINKPEYQGSFDTPEEAFFAYKKRKEEIIKQVAQEEFNKGNITKQCYDAMMKYEVEITD